MYYIIGCFLLEANNKHGCTDNDWTPCSLVLYCVGKVLGPTGMALSAAAGRRPSRAVSM